MMHYAGWLGLVAIITFAVWFTLLADWLGPRRYRILRMAAMTMGIGMTIASAASNVPDGPWLKDVAFLVGLVVAWRWSQGAMDKWEREEQH